MESRRRGLCWTHEFSQRYHEDLEFRRNRNRTKREYNRRLLRRYRDRIAAALGGWKCVMCGVAEKDVLSFDHKSGGGEDERNNMGGQLPTIRYYYHNLRAANERLQVLCANCNWERNAKEKYGKGPSQRAAKERQSREALMDLIGGHKCLGCGQTNLTVLTVDHTNGGGTKDRRLKRGYQSMIYYYLTHAEEARKTLQVLCRNCNWKRHVMRNIRAL